MADRADVERAVAIVERSRSTHVEWLAWQEAHPNWRDLVEPDSPGGPEHHRESIGEYDHVLSVLRSTLNRAGVRPGKAVPGV